MSKYGFNANLKARLGQMIPIDLVYELLRSAFKYYPFAIHV